MRPPLLLLTFAALAAEAAPKLDFNRDIRPILSDNCFACHGFDAKKRKADLRLDTAEGATAINDGVQAIKPGDPDGSELIKRLLTKDPEEVMPPPESHKKLTQAQIDTLRRWIAEGAPYRKHWSFEPPVRPAVPAAAAGTSPVDAFLNAELSAQGLQPAPEADKARLLRRVTLDLTGLPPTPAEVDAFLADASPQAYDQVVERLLGSSRYGEHMARGWLDAARYEGLQRQPALRRLHHLAARRRSPAERHPRAAHRQRFQPLQRHHQRRRLDQRRTPLPLRRRPHRHHHGRVDGPDRRLRGLP